MKNRTSINNNDRRVLRCILDYFFDDPLKIIQLDDCIYNSDYSVRKYDEIYSTINLLSSLKREARYPTFEIKDFFEKEVKSWMEANGKPSKMEISHLLPYYEVSMNEKSFLFNVLKHSNCEDCWPTNDHLLIYIMLLCLSYKNNDYGISLPPKIMKKLQIYSLLGYDNFFDIEFNETIKRSKDTLEFGKRAAEERKTKDIIEIIKNHSNKTFCQAFNVKNIFLFGSFARNQNSVNSDIDLHVVLRDNRLDLNVAALNIKEYFEEKTNLEIDVITTVYGLDFNNRLKIVFLGQIKII